MFFTIWPPPRQRAGIRHDPRDGEEHQIHLHEARGKRSFQPHAADEGQGHDARQGAQFPLNLFVALPVKESPLISGCRKSGEFCRHI